MRINGLYLCIGSLVFGSLVAGGCGQQTATPSTTTTTTLPQYSQIIIVGMASTSNSSSGLKAQAALSDATVSIGMPAKDTDGLTEVASGTTGSDGGYSINVLISSLQNITASNNYAANLMVTISKEGTTIGCVISSLSLEANKQNFAPPANPGMFIKQKMARSLFKKGIDPKTFDFSDNIDENFSEGSLSSLDQTKIDKFANSIKGGMDAEGNIAQALGISSSILSQMKQKGMELNKLYIEPIMQKAYQSKTQPSQSEMDAAMTSMEAAMKDFAVSLGITEQQFADLKAFKDKQVETKMGEEGFTGSDPAFKESKRRMMGKKIIDFFLGQWDAANVLATIAPSGKSSFAAAKVSGYNSFVSGKETIKAQLNEYLRNTELNPQAIPDYLRNNFFDAYVFPPPQFIPSPGQGSPDPASMEAMMSQYKDTRIMVYFMHTFLGAQGRNTFQTNIEGTMKAVFRNRFENKSSSYYMGPDFWSTFPVLDQIQTRLAAFQTALENAVDNNTAIRNLLTDAGFSNSQVTSILKAFRIINAPPDTVI